MGRSSSRSPSRRSREKRRRRHRRRRRSSSSSSSSSSSPRRRRGRTESSARTSSKTSGTGTRTSDKGSRSDAVARSEGSRKKSKDVVTSNDVVDVMSDLRRSQALLDIEDSSFKQSSFVSSRALKIAQIALPDETSGNKSDLAFGTNLEKEEIEEKEAVLVKVDSEALCHQKWRPNENREHRWIHKLLQLRLQRVHKRPN